MSSETSRLIELIEPEKLYQLQERISSTSDVIAVILDHNGDPVTPLAHLSGYCMRRDETDGASCEKLHHELFLRARASGRPELDLCPNSRLSAAALPVYSQGELVCVWMLCQFHYREWGKANTAPEPLIEKENIPELNRSSLGLLMDFITMLTEDVLQLTLYNGRISAMEQQAQHLAYTDRLLGLPNTLQMDRDVRDGRTGQLIVLDIADLRKINDVYGRESGDLLLKAMRDYLRELAIPRSRLYRLDVAHFAILVEGTDEETVRRLARILYRRCSDVWNITMGGQVHEFFVTVNVGVLPVGRGASADTGSLGSAVEHTLDTARRTDGIALFDDAENRSFRNRLRLELSLRQSVRENMQGFYLHYQPIVDPGVAVWRGVEALCRWESEEFGIVSPTEFIRLAETSGLIGMIGRWVLEQSVKQVKGWGLDQVENFVLDVNLSPVQLLDPELDRKVIEILQRHDYPADKLCLEITESNELGFSRQCLGMLQRLRDYGVVIALDDFGAGYASYNMLYKLPVSILKTDRSLIQNVENDSFLKRLFYVMVEMAHASGMKIVAEGVETDSQARLLLREGADFFQGYHFSRPVSAQVMGGMLENFRAPSGELVSMGYSRIDLSRLSDEQGGYELPPSLYKLLSRCMQVLFSVPDADDAIETALAYIGQELAVSRSYVFIRERDGTWSNTHEWCAPGVVPEKPGLQHADIESISPKWIDALKRDGMLVAADIRMLEPGTLDILEAQGIRAVVEFPIWREGELFGFVGFDDCEAIHYWTREEIQMLHILTNIISSTLSRMYLQQQVVRQGERMHSMLNDMETLIYVSDLDTNEILFANTELQHVYGEQPLLGRTCWEALQKREDRCPFCPVPRLLEHPGRSFQWEFYNEVLGAHFRVVDSIIPWDDDRQVHFEYALNITELKNYQKRLEEFASMDVLTGALNRNGFLESARICIQNAILEGRVSTIAFIDIDGLKAANDQHGHSAGDALICAVVDALRRNIRNTDLIGRYGGDEFVVLLQGCTAENAEWRMRVALEQLQMPSQEDARHSFSYGLAESNEVPWSTLNSYLEALINKADLRMIEYKRKHRTSRV